MSCRHLGCCLWYCWKCMQWLCKISSHKSNTSHQWTRDAKQTRFCFRGTCPNHFGVLHFSLQLGSHLKDLQLTPSPSNCRCEHNWWSCTGAPCNRDSKKYCLVSRKHKLVYSDAHNTRDAEMTHSFTHVIHQSKHRVQNSTAAWFRSCWTQIMLQLHLYEKICNWLLHLLFVKPTCTLK